MVDSSSPEVPLQPSVEELINKICVDKGLTPPDISARRSLSTITEASAIEILNKIAASKTIRTFSGFIIHMVKTNSSAVVSSSNGVSSSPHKRSLSPFAAESPNKYVCSFSPNAKQFVDATPFSSSKTRTIPQYFPRSPHDDSGTSNSKQIICLEDANPNTAAYHLAESSKATHIVSAPTQLIFSPCSTLKDANSSIANGIVCTVHKRLVFSPGCTSNGANPNTVKQHFVDSPNASPHFPSVQKNTLSWCSSSEGTHLRQFSDFSIGTQNGSVIQEQHALSPCNTFRGATPGNIILTPNRSDHGNIVLAPNRSDHTRSLAISQQTLILDELEFRKLFMVHSYVGRKKIEDVVSVDDASEIKSMKSLSMFDFEAKLWAKYGRTFCEPCDRAMHLDWDSGKTYLYHCYVSADGNYQFKGPYLNTRRTHLQRVLGDDNVLIVQFTDDPEASDMPSNHCNWSAAYQRISGGISIGLRHYCLFAFKDGRGDNKNPNAYSKKKQVSSWAVKCYFVRKGSLAPWKDKKDPYILLKKTSHEARSLFMHVHMVSSMAKYISRCSLALSNTVKLRVDLSSVHVETIPDIPCCDEHGHVVCDEDGEPLIHTDGTGFISEDLAILCAKDFIEAKGKHDGSFEFVDLLKLEEESLGPKGSEACIIEPPLLVQCRLFKEGYAVKGTLLVNKQIGTRKIQVRPSMIKVEQDSRLSDSDSFSSLEIVSISRKPRKANLSKNLIALLSVGGVPKEYFLGLLETALQDAQKVSSSMRAAVRVGLNYAQMDDSATSVAMIGSGIPVDEPYLQYRLSILANEERKGLRGGKLPVNESFYLIGTADPTETLNSDEVCIILETGQISGKVLVYRNPGLHFGDIHILNARYVEKMEDFVGNAKYGIFFSTKGRRSVGSEIANGDFDGDLYWVFRSPHVIITHF